VIAITLFHPAFNRRDWDRTFNYSGGIRVKLTDDCRINFQIGYQKSIKAIVNSGISKEFWHQATFGLVEIEYPLAKLLKKKIK
jgi:hypothetical protein